MKEEVKTEKTGRKMENRITENLRDRTKKYAIKIVHFYSLLPSKSHEAQIIGKQVLRSGTSARANYREACRARSDSEFVSKIGIVVQELDETIYWLELLFDAKINSSAELKTLLSEANELIAIFTSIVKKVRRK
ncbi:MAG: four helix bundle protein [Nitrospirota bacterium]